MKGFLLLLILSIASGCSSAIQPQTPPPGPVTGSVYFIPQVEETEAIVRELDKAQNSILVQSYSFFSSPIANALVSAQERGVSVQILLDKGSFSDQASGIDILTKAGIPIKLDTARAIAPSKVMIIDGETVITGSSTFTKSSENLLVIRHRSMAEQYIKNWKKHAENSEPYVVREK